MPSDVLRRDGRVTGRALLSFLHARHNGGGLLQIVHVHVAEPSLLTDLGDLTYKYNGLCVPDVLLSVLYLPDK